MQITIDETNRRREKQLKYNEENNITPTQIINTTKSVFNFSKNQKVYVEAPESVNLAADPIVQYMSKDGLNKSITQTKKLMEAAAKDLDFMEATRLRDEMFALQKLLKEKFNL